MGGVFRSRGQTILPVLLCISLAGCTRPAGVQAGSAQAGDHPAPFRDSNIPAQPENAAPSDEAANSDGGVPFRDAQSLPAGTLLTVRLKNPISSGSSSDNPTFVALVDEPVVVEGATLVPRGASVAGRIESARSSTMKHNRAYVRLTLDLVDIAGHELPIRTSSLFARGNARGTPDGKAMDAVSLEQGRRLTFRLAEPAYVAGQASDVHR